MDSSDDPIWQRPPKERVVPVIQSQEGECGLACLAMILTSHGARITLHEARTRFRTSSRGSTLHQLMSHAEKLGFDSRALRLEPDELSSLSLPAILHWDMCHYVVLEKVERNHIVVCDPSHGRKRLSQDQVCRSFTGVALELWATATVAQPGRRPSSRMSLASLNGIWRTLAQLLLLTGTLEALALTSPLLTQWLVDETNVTSSKELIVTMGSAFVLLQIVQNGVTYIRGLIAHHLGCDLSLKRKTGFFGHLISLPHAFFETRSIGDIASKFASVDSIQQTLLSAVGTFAIDGLVAAFCLCIMLTYQPAIACISLLSLTVIVAIRIFSFATLRRMSASQIEQTALAQSHLLETLRGIRVIQMFGRHRGRKAAWHNLLVAQYNSMYRSLRLRSNIGQVCGMIAGIEGIATLCCGASAVVSGSWTMGAVMAFSSYRSTFANRTVSVIEKILELAMLRIHFDRLEDVLVATKDDFDFDDERGECHLASHDIRIEDLTFRYAHGENTVLRGVNLLVHQGECVAITGASGSGKTTLIKLLLGILEPTRGDVQVAGYSGRHLRALSRSGTVAAVMQDDSMFAGSIEENIHCFDPEADLGRVVTCAVASRIHDEVISMPMGYMTLVGDMGASLSGGQRQRIALARALYRQPKVLILDEATSHLDIANESLISEAVRELDITRIVIAHRQETVSTADRVIEINNGQLFELAREGCSDLKNR